MAKQKKAPSIRSRAARRATSPSIDTDKSLKQLKPPPESVDYRPAILAVHHNSGVTKKLKKGRKVLSSKARRRQEKGYDKALAVMEKTAVKVEKSKGQLKAVHARRKTWDEINKENEKLSKVRPVVEVKDGVTNGWETDEDMDDAEAEQPEAAAALPDDPLPEPQTNDVEDEIL